MGGLADRAKSRSAYLSGNPLMDVLDVLGTANFAAAGATDALLSGQNPIAGAGAGIADRMSFIDVLEKRNVPAAAAVPLGLAADFIVPVVPGLGLVRGASKLAARSRALEAGERLVQEAPDIDTVIDLALKSPEAMGLVKDSAVDLTRAARAGEAARSAYRAADPAVRTETARNVAQQVRHGPIPENVNALVAQLIDQGPQSGSTVTGWRAAVEDVSERLIYAFRTRLQNNPMFRDVGAKFAGMLDQRNSAKRALTSQLMQEVDNITGSIPKEMHDDLFRLLNGDATVRATPELQQHADAIKGLLDKLWNKMDANDVHQTMGPETTIWKRLQMDGQGAALRYLRSAQADIAKNGALSNEARDALNATSEGRFVLHLMDNNMHIDDMTGRIVGKLRRVQDYVPLVARKGREKILNSYEIENMSAALRAIDPQLSPQGSIAAAKQILESVKREPGDIRATLQHARSGRPVVNEQSVKDFVTDPRAYLTKYVEDSGDLIANSQVFGGRGGKYAALRDELAAAHGYGSSAAIAGKPHPEYSAALGEMDRAYEIVNGASLDPAARLVRGMNAVSDTLFLGPRTIMIQMTTFMNQAATQGLRNAMSGMVDSIMEPRFRKMVRRTEAIVPTMLDTVDEAGVLDKVSKWNFILRGVGAADRGMRMGAAIGGATALAEKEAEILKLVQAGNLARAEKVAGYTRRFFGVDTAGLLRGERLSDAALWQGAANSANMTNFTGDITSLPKAFQSTSGKFFLKFKQYGMQQGMFINRIAQEGFKHGNWGPVLRYAATMPWIYSHVLRAVQQFRSSDRQVDPDSDPRKYLQDLLMLGGFGYLGDLSQAFGSPSEGMKLGFVAGPNVGAMAKLSKAAIYAIPGEGQDLEETMRNVTPQGVRQLGNLWSNLSQ